MNKPQIRTLAAKRIALAAATLCASLSAPVFASTDDVKAMMDLLLKKGVISQADYDQQMKAAQEAAENREFKEKRIDKDVAKANEFLLKNKDAGQVMKNGIGLQSADGANTIQLMGRLHMDYRGYNPGYASGTTKTDPLTDVLDVRRARLGVRGQIDKDFKYEIQGTYGMADNGMSDSVTAIDIAFADYAANPAAMLRVGKFKMPFSLEQLTSSNNIDFMERSFASQNEGEYIPAKETGVMVFGSPMPGTYYGLAYSRGRANKSAVYDSPDVIGRVSANLAKVAMGRDDVITHLGFGYSTGRVKSATSYASGRDESRAYSGFFNGTEAVAAGSTRTRQAIEYAIAYGPYKAQGEFFQIGYSDMTGTNAGSNAIKMNYNELLWNITGESHNYSNSSGTFGWIKPNTKFSSNGGLGAWQVGVRLSDFDGSDFTQATGKTTKATSMTYGLNWFVNDNVRVMLNYVETKYDSSVLVATGTSLDKIKAIMLRTQIWF